MVEVKWKYDVVSPAGWFPQIRRPKNLPLLGGELNFVVAGRYVWRGGKSAVGRQTIDDRAYENICRQPMD